MELVSAPPPNTTNLEYRKKVSLEFETRNLTDFSLFMH